MDVRSCKNSKSRFEMNDKIPSQTEVETVRVFHLWDRCVLFVIFLLCVIVLVSGCSSYSTAEKQKGYALEVVR